jgi:glycosyltransferase involved in cell wall biosynthesis
MRLRQTIHTFDVVHLHSVFLWPTWMAARIAFSADKPYFLSPRGMLVNDLIKRKSHWVKAAWVHLIERHTIARAAGVHVTSELEAAELRALGFILPDVTCVPNGVQWPSIHAFFEPDQLEERTGSPHQSLDNGSRIAPGDRRQ